MSAEDTNTIYATLSANMFAACGIIMAYEISRGQRDIYAPRIRTNRSRTPGVPPTQWFGWIKHTIDISDEDTLLMVGMDAFVLLRFVRLCAKVFGVVGILGASVLIPVYYTASNPTEIEGIEQYSIVTVENRGNRLWAAVASAWVFSLLFVYLLKEEYEYFVYLRQKFMTSGDPEIPLQKLLTVKVENIPVEHQSSEKLYILFNDLFPNDIYSAVCCQNLQSIESVVEEKHSVLLRLETALGYEELASESKVMIDLDTGYPTYCYGGIEYPKAIQYFCSRLISLNNGLAKQREIALSSDEVVNLGLSGDKSLSQSFKDKSQPLSEPLLDVVQAMSKTKSGGALSSMEEGGSQSLSIVVDDTNNSPSKPSTPSPKKGTSLSRKFKKVGSKFKKAIVQPLDLPSTIPIPKMDLQKILGREEFTRPLYTSTGFVTFNSRRAHALAYQVSMLTNRFPELTAEQAAAPEDVIWANVTVPEMWVLHSMTITSIMYYSGLLFWTVILAFIAALSNLDNIAEYVPALDHLQPVYYAFLSGLLPVVVFMLFTNYIPVFMGWVSIYFERIKSKSKVADQVCYWFFYYQLANIYLLLFTGSLFNCISDAIDDPSSIFNLLGSALPSISLFFMNYLITQVLFQVPYALLQPYQQVMLIVYRYFMNQQTLTRRQLVEGPLAKVPFDYGSNIPSVLYIMCIVQTYWVITPLIPIIGFFYFVGYYVVTKHQMLFLYCKEFETGGAFFYRLFDNSMFCLIISAGLLIAYVSIKEGVKQGPFLLPLPFVIYYFWHSLNNQFKHKSADMAYNCAVSGDTIGDACIPTDQLLTKFSDDAYAQPCLRVSTSGVDVIPTPHRINGEPLLVDGSEVDVFDQLSGLTTKSAGKALASVKPLKTIGSGVSAVNKKLKTQLNVVYYNNYIASEEEIAKFYEDMEAKFYPKARESADSSHSPISDYGSNRI